MFEDREVTYWFDNEFDELRSVSGKVLLCEDKIGVTIVEDADDKNYLLCVVCEQSPKFKKLKRTIPGLNQAAYDYVVSCIKNDFPIYNSSISRIVEEFMEVSRTWRGSPDSSRCAFSD